MSRTRGSAPARKQPATARAGQPAARTIKKYPNRRLYDTDSSSYITLAQVRQLVMDGKAFVVRVA